MAKKKTASKAPAKKKPATKAAKPAAANKKKSTAAKPATQTKAAPKTVKKATTKSTSTAKTTPKKKQPAAPSQPAGVPMIDTNLAAQTAATMLINRDQREAPAPAAEGAQPKESSSFKNLKEQLARPKSAGLGGLLGPVGGEKKQSGHFFNQQKGHNQTYGGFNKTGVPRRTNG